MSETTLIYGMDAPLFPVGAEVQAPARLNAAGYCCGCLERWCTKVRCIEDHLAERWGVCVRCEGKEWRDGEEPSKHCSCWSGMVTEDEDAIGVLDGLLYDPVLSDADAVILAAHRTPSLRSVAGDR